MDLYTVLGIEQNASAEMIKQSYHKLILKYHPDRNKQQKEMKDENEKFLQIQSAWETLRDDNKRKFYDKQLNQCKNKKSNISISYHTTLDDLELIDKEKDENGKTINIYEYPCRCGDYFEIQIHDPSHLMEQEKPKSVITSCPTCCLNLELAY